MDTILYKDFDYNLPKNTNLDFNFVENYESIHQSITTIIMTKKGSRTQFQNPYFGSNIHKILFEKMSLFTSIQIKNEIALALELWEPRIEIIEIIVDADQENNLYNVAIHYKIVELNIEDELVLTLGVVK